MKLVDDIQICKGFAICKGIMTADDTYHFTVANTTQSGTFSQLGYCASGSAVLHDKDGIKKHFEAGNLYDVRDCYGKEFDITTGPNGGTWFNINPMPAEKVYNGELLKADTKRKIIGGKNEQVVICIDGYIKINNTTSLGQFQYVRILAGKEVEVEVSANSIGLYFYTL